MLSLKMRRSIDSMYARKKSKLKERLSFNQASDITGGVREM